jgi:hypothetical protein
MHGLERYTTLLDIGRDSIDDGIGSRHGSGDRSLLAHIRPKERDLS